ncbi:hypothetical protein TEA_019313 [Camellia sinensis var. sinensis]|uniref:Uncharacterized protein n=1 Tax=Camellia sinensis var. sinensis TaxID=542762 RepID=A0A4S4D7D0_CAMSN|nr:hypothetical protein TEA_019313 [Camellia sinensis var. sinensis]
MVQFVYTRERRDKLSEDFIFRVLPAEMRDVHLTKREKQKLKWSQIMPYKESFAWAIVHYSITIAAASGGSASSVVLWLLVSLGKFPGWFSESSAKIALDGKPGYSSGSSVVVEISKLEQS